MRPGTVARWAGLVALVAAPLHAAGPRDPDVASLVNGFMSGSSDEVARAGQRAGARRLAVALAGADRVEVMAAAAAAPAAEDALWLLPALADKARSADRPLAARAARSSASIALATDRAAILERDAPLDWLRLRIAEYRAIAADARRWADVRVAALEVATHLARALGEAAGPDDAPFDAAAVLGDPDPEIRRAALELLPAPLRPAELALVAARVQDDAERPLVALVAGQVACEGIVVGDSPRAVLAALGGRGVARLRLLVANKALPAAARLGAARCLVAEGSPKSKAALGTLPQRRKKTRR